MDLDALGDQWWRRGLPGQVAVGVGRTIQDVVDQPLGESATPGGGFGDQVGFGNQHASRGQHRATLHCPLALVVGAHPVERDRLPEVVGVLAFVRIEVVVVGPGSSDREAVERVGDLAFGVGIELDGTGGTDFQQQVTGLGVLGGSQGPVGEAVEGGGNLDFGGVDHVATDTVEFLQQSLAFDPVGDLGVWLVDVLHRRWFGDQPEDERGDRLDRFFVLHGIPGEGETGHSQPLVVTLRLGLLVIVAAGCTEFLPQEALAAVMDEAAIEERRAGLVFFDIAVGELLLTERMGPRPRHFPVDALASRSVIGLAVMMQELLDVFDGELGTVLATPVLELGADGPGLLETRDVVTAVAAVAVDGAASEVHQLHVTGQCLAVQFDLVALDAGLVGFGIPPTADHVLCGLGADDLAGEQLNQFVNRRVIGRGNRFTCQRGVVTGQQEGGDVGGRIGLLVALALGIQEQVGHPGSGEVFLWVADPGVEPTEPGVGDVCWVLGVVTDLVLDSRKVRPEGGRKLLAGVGDRRVTVAGQAAAFTEGDGTSLGVGGDTLGHGVELEVGAGLLAGFQEEVCHRGDFDRGELLGVCVTLICEVEELGHPRGRSEISRFADPAAEPVLVGLESDMGQAGADFSHLSADLVGIGVDDSFQFCGGGLEPEIGSDGPGAVEAGDLVAAEAAEFAYQLPSFIQLWRGRTEFRVDAEFENLVVALQARRFS